MSHKKLINGLDYHQNKKVWGVEDIGLLKREFTNRLDTRMWMQKN